MVEDTSLLNIQFKRQHNPKIGRYFLPTIVGMNLLIIIRDDIVVNAPGENHIKTNDGLLKLI